jgi:CRP-like cAMP-binding protein
LNHSADTSAQSGSAPGPDLLRGIYLFSAFDTDQLGLISSTTERVSLNTGGRLFNQGDDIRHFYYVESGQIKLYRLSPDGDEKIIDLVGQEQTFAEAVVFMERESGYPVNADAIVPTRLLAFDAGTFLDLLRKSNESCLQLMAVMSRRLRAHVNEIDRLALQNATCRFIGYILDAADKEEVQDNRVELEVPKNVLASRLSIQPETFSRILSRLSSAGLIKTDRNAITLLDINKLHDHLKTPG